MKALVLRELKQSLQWEERPDPQPRPNEVVVELRAAALNRRDYWITQGLYPGIRLPMILGSDGAGVVTAAGAGVDADWLGREVVLNPGWEWGDDERVQSSRFRILGMPDDGTLATHVVAPVQYLYPKPLHLDWREAAALPLAGLTAYRALLVQGRMKEGERVLVTGAGGGVATFVLQFAVAGGAQVSVTSSSRQKLDRALALGATAGFNYREETWVQQCQAACGAFDLIVDSAGGDGYAALIELVTPGGRIVNYGATAGPPKKLDLFKVFWKQLQLIGSTMGSAADFAAMLEFVNRRQLRPVIDQEFALADGNAALERLRDSRQFGKIVLRP